MDKLEVTLEFERQTKSTYRYKEPEDSKGMPPVIGTMYIQKWPFAGAAPDRIKVTIEEVK